jgi:hypothetical protein
MGNGDLEKGWKGCPGPTTEPALLALEGPSGRKKKSTGGMLDMVRRLGKYMGEERHEGDRCIFGEQNCKP